MRGYGGEELYEETSSASWSKKKIRFTTGPDDTEATVFIYKPTAGGFAYADDVTLVEVDPEAPEEVIFDDEPDDLEPGTVVVNDSDVGTGLFRYEFAGNWMTGQNIHAYKGDVTFSNTTNDYYQVRFNGTGIQLYSEKGTVMGIVAVSIDGGEETLVDLYAPAEEAAGNVLVYTSFELEPGEHILKVRITGMKNEHSGGTWHVADRVVVLGAPDEEPEPEPEPELKEVLSEDFESTALGSMPQGWIISDDDPISVTEDASGNKILMIKESGNGTGTSAGIRFEPVKDKVTAEMRVMAKQTGVRGNFLSLRDSGGNIVVELLFDQDYDQSGRRNIAIRTPGNHWTPLMQYAADEWYDIYVEIDLNESKYSVSINGAAAAEDIPVLHASSEISQYVFSTYSWGAGTFYVDDLRISGVLVNPPEPEPERVFGELYAQDFEDAEIGTLPNGWTALRGADQGITDNDPVSVTEDVYGNRRLTIKESGNGLESWALFSFGEPIRNRIGVEVSVMAEQTGKTASFLMLRDSANRKIVEIMFDQDYDNSGRRNIARRTPDGNWTGLMPYEAHQWYRVYVEADLDAGTYDVTIDGIKAAENIPVLTPASDEAAIYQFGPHRWDAGTYHIDDLRILAMIEPGNEEEPGNEKTAADNRPTVPADQPSQTVLEAKDGVILIRAKADMEGKAAVTVSESDIAAALTDEAKESLRIRIQSAEASAAEVRLPAEQLRGALQQGLKEISIHAGFAAVAVSADQLQSIIGTETEQIFFSVKKAGADQLPSQVWEHIGNRPVLDFQFGTEKGAVSSLEYGVSAEIEYQLQPGEDPHAIVVCFINDAGEMEIQKYSIYDPETGTVRFKPKHFSRFAVVHHAVHFSDLAGYDWAKASIAALSAREIAKGSGDGRFHPGANITRAEFVQLLMNTLDMQASTAEGSGFADAEPGAWYEHAVNTAKTLGIVQGKPDGTFGISEPIARQDAAVMLYRAGLILRTIDAPSKEAGFADADDIADYAAEAAAAVQQAGWMQGFADGRFAPLHLTTRAEAAVMLHRFLLALMP